MTQPKRRLVCRWNRRPTSPQLYVNGEFVGGSDIMTEMYQAGELQQTLGTTA